MEPLNDLVALALRHHRDGRLAQAEPLYRRVLAADPDHFDALHLLGVLAGQTGDVDAAVELIRKAVARNDRHAAAFHNLGDACRAAGLLEEAENACRRAIALDPSYAPAHGSLGNALYALGRLHEAEAAYRRALALRPGHAAAHCNLGNALRDLGRPEEAEDAYRRAIALAPDLAVAHNNLGGALRELDRPGDAEAAFRQAIALRPQDADARVGLGNALHDQGRLTEAEDAYRSAIAAAPDHGAAHLLLLMSSLPVAPADAAQSSDAALRFAEGLDAFRSAAAGAAAPRFGEAVGTAQPFYLGYRPGDHTETLSRYGDAVCDLRNAWFRERGGEVARAEGPRRRKRPRLAIVSGHLRRHPVWDVLLHGLLLHLDRSRFEVFLYHTSPAGSAEGECARQRVDRFVQGPRDWVALAREDRPEILLYPEIGMDPAAAKLATLRLAPVQAAYWGHPITTGLPTMDLFFSGDLLEPPDAQRHYRERLVRLPGTGACSVWTPFPARSPGLDLPADRGVARFLICQQAAKYDPSFDAIYPRIARDAGPCGFWFVRDGTFPWASAIVEARIRDAFVGAGLDPAEYVRFVDWQPREEFAGLLDAMDICLDTPAFSGYTTAWQAVHRALPVVTLDGPFLRQRLAAGLLRRMGLTGTVAADGEAYVAKAVALARSPEGRSALRGSLRDRATAADDDVRVVRALEASLEEALAATAGRSPT